MLTSQTFITDDIYNPKATTVYYYETCVLILNIQWNPVNVMIPTFAITIDHW